MKKIFMIAIVLFAVTMMGCEAHMHMVGKGQQNGNMVEARQWYILFGLVPLNTVDTSQLAGDATNYTIETETSPLDVLMNVFTMNVSVTSRTVTVTK